MRDDLRNYLQQHIHFAVVRNIGEIYPCSYSMSDFESYLTVELKSQMIKDGLTDDWRELCAEGGRTLSYILSNTLYELTTDKVLRKKKLDGVDHFYGTSALLAIGREMLIPSILYA